MLGQKDLNFVIMWLMSDLPHGTEMLSIHC